MLLLLSCISFCSAGQSPPASARINYSWNGSQLIPVDKEEYQHDRLRRQVGESFFINFDETVSPNWILTSRRTIEYDNENRRRRTATESFYELQAGQAVPVVRQLFENFNLFEDPLGFTDLSITSTFDESGNQTSQRGNRFRQVRNSDGCVIANISEENTAPNLPDNAWTVTFRQEFEVDGDCETLASNSYRNEVLVGQIIIERNRFGQITFEESIQGIDRPDILSRNTRISVYNDRGKLQSFQNSFYNANSDREQVYREYYVYNPLGQVDTVFFEIDENGTVEKGFRNTDYDPSGRIALTENYSNNNDSIDLYILASYSTNTWDENGRILSFTSFSCRDDDRCFDRNSSFTYNEYNDVVYVRREVAETQNGLVTNTRVSEEEVHFRCDRARIEEKFSSNGINTSRTEWIYPLLPDCEEAELEDRIVLAPNLSSDFIAVWSSFFDGNPVRTTIIDVTGRVISEETMRPFSTFRLDVSDFPAGSYLLQMVIGGEEFTKKFIKTDP